MAPMAPQDGWALGTDEPTWALGMDGAWVLSMDGARVWVGPHNSSELMGLGHEWTFDMDAL